MHNKSKMSDYWNMGTSIVLGAAFGIVLGALLQSNSVALLWSWFGCGSRSTYHAI